MIPNDRAAIILNLVFGDPPDLRLVPAAEWRPAPRAEVLAALAQIHQHPVALLEEALP